PWKRGPKVQGPIPPVQRTVNAASWGAEDHYGDRPQPDTDPQGAAQAASPQTGQQKAASAKERESVIQLDDRSRS
ncbi:MAG: hypothetical protein K0Q70_468, partial [Rhodospirillales bacterium]|nr:hypothetical protein [Rhodospirillales bacterium]